MDLTWGAITIAFTAGMAAAVNPCGFALLPAYLGFFIGTDQEERSTIESAIRSLGVGLVLTIGFILVFAPFGLITGAVSSSIQEQLPYVTVAVGVILVVVGVALVSGFEPTFAVPKLDKGGETRQFGSMLLFGISYAVASLSCTIGPFIAVVGASVSGSDVSFLSRLITFAAYGVGMGALITLLTLAVGLAKQGFITKLRKVMPHINRISGAIMVVVGLYVAWYGWYEIRLFVLERNVTSDPIIDAALGIQDTMNALVQDNQAVIGWVALAAVVLVVASAGFRKLNPSTSGPGSGT